jgi:ADP-ribosyl-[dinitrogen reductase] hydrolase
MAMMSQSMKHSKVLAGLMGVCVGDALGVPVENSTREELAQKTYLLWH